MKLYIKKDWIQKFDHEEKEVEYIAGKDMECPKHCGCGNLAEAGGFCEECIDGYRGEDQ